MKKYKPSKKAKEMALWSILKHFQWQGARMLFPVKDPKNGYIFLARIDGKDIYKIIKYIERI